MQCIFQEKTEHTFFTSFYTYSTSKPSLSLKGTKPIFLLTSFTQGCQPRDDNCMLTTVQDFMVGFAL